MVFEFITYLYDSIWTILFYTFIAYITVKILCGLGRLSNVNIDLEKNLRDANLKYVNAVHERNDLYKRIAELRVSGFYAIDKTYDGVLARLKLAIDSEPCVAIKRHLENEYDTLKVMKN